MIRLFKNLRCWLFHLDHIVVTPVYHYWDIHCMKCGNTWHEDDF